MIKPIGFDNWISNNFVTDSTGRDFTIIGSFAQIVSGAWRVFRGPSIIASTAADPCVITTAEAHGFHTRQLVRLKGFPGTLAGLLDEQHEVTVLSPTTFSVPVDTSASYATSLADNTLGLAVAGVDCDFTAEAAAIVAYLPGKNCTDAHGPAHERAFIG